MANKLTKDKLDLLIEQVLSEDLKISVPNINVKGKSNDVKKQLGTKNISIANLRKIVNLDSDPADTLEDEDFEAAYENPDSIEAQIAKALKSSTNADIASAARDADPGYQTQSITAPRTYSAGAASSNFIKGISSIFGSVLTETDPAKLLTQLTQISMDVFDLSKIEALKEDRKTLLRKFLAMDYLQMLTFDLDSKRQGGYDFEAFLAMIFQGGVVGGSNKAGDFTASDGTKGSAKYVEDFSVGQSLSGFEKNEEVIYVIARKAKSETPGSDLARTSAQATADPDKILVANIHAFRVKVTNKTRTEATWNVMDYDGNVLHEGLTGNLKGTTEMSGKTSEQKNETLKKSYIGQLRLRHSATAKQTLRQFLDSELENSTQDNLKTQREAYTLMKNYFQNLFKLDDATREYIATDDDQKQIERGNAILDGYDAVDNQMVELINMIRGTDKTKATVKTGDRTKLREKNQTKTLKDLDKLIERVIIESMNKK